jgi:hypothetical protein
VGCKCPTQAKGRLEWATGERCPSKRALQMSRCQSLMLNRRSSFAVAIVTVFLLAAGASPFVLARRARAEARRYVAAVMNLGIGTTYDTAIAQLRRAQIPLVLPTTCQHDCVLLFDFDDKWLYRLRWAAPLELAGRLDFRDQQLVYKSTSMGHESCCFVTVLESPLSSSTISLGNLDSSGRPAKPVVQVSPLDFSEYRKDAYSLNVACIGSIKACAVDEYLPIVTSFRRQHGTAAE